LKERGQRSVLIEASARRASVRRCQSPLVAKAYHSEDRFASLHLKRLDIDRGGKSRRLMNGLTATSSTMRGLEHLDVLLGHYGMSLASGVHVCPSNSHGFTGAVSPDASDM